MDDSELKEIEKRANEATPGPWEWQGFGPEGVRTVVAQQDLPESHKERETPFIFTGTGELWWCDLEFIAHSRQDVPALIAAVRERDERLRRVVEVLEKPLMHSMDRVNEAIFFAQEEVAPSGQE